MAVKQLDIYVCTRPECPDYYGSTNMPVLERKMTRGMGPNGEIIGVPFPRSDCPTCRAKGDTGTRVRIRVEVDVPETAPAPAEVQELDWTGPHAPYDPSGTGQAA